MLRIGSSKTPWLSILATIAKQGRIRLSERTIAGLEKARKQGRIGGRQRLIVNRHELARLDAEGLPMAEVGEELGIPAASFCQMLKAHQIKMSR
jgi:DNA invertase Pin-like site-specific DNA recombinase